MENSLKILIALFLISYVLMYLVTLRIPRDRYAGRREGIVSRTKSTLERNPQLRLLVFLILTLEVLRYIISAVPALTVPIAIFGALCIIWFSILMWRSSKKRSDKIISGVMLFIVVFSVLSIVGQNILKTRQAATVKMECTGYQKAYDQAIATHANAKTIKEDKLVLRACLARKEACLKDLGDCTMQSLL